MRHEWLRNEADRLSDEFAHPNGCEWGEHPDWPVSEWQEAVGQGGMGDDNDTRLGYWEWVANEISNAQEEQRLDAEQET